MKNSYNAEKARRNADTDRAYAGSHIIMAGRIRWNATFSSVCVKESNYAF